MTKEVGAEFRFLDPRFRHIEGFYKKSPRLIPSAADGSMCINTRGDIKASIQIASDLPPKRHNQVFDRLVRKLPNALAKKREYIFVEQKKKTKKRKNKKRFYLSNFTTGAKYKS